MFNTVVTGEDLNREARSDPYLRAAERLAVHLANAW